jgi:hypothetical protein
VTRVLVLLLATACSGGSAAAVAAGPSRADYVRAAEKICAEANAKQKALTTPTSLPALAPYVSRVVAIADEATTRLAALSPPVKDRADLQAKVLGPLQSQLADGHVYADKVAAASKANDLKTLGELLTNAPTATRADLRFMKSYGFTECIEAADTGS